MDTMSIKRKNNTRINHQLQLKCRKHLEMSLHRPRIPIEIKNIGKYRRLNFLGMKFENLDRLEMSVLDHVHLIVDVIIIVIEKIVPIVIDLTNIIIDVVHPVKIDGSIIIDPDHLTIAIEIIDVIVRRAKSNK